MANRDSKFDLFQKRPLRLLLVVLLCSLLVAVFTGLTIMTNTITIYDGDNVLEITTTDTDPVSILADEGILLESEDHFEFTGIENRTGTIYVLRPFAVTYTDHTGSTEMIVTSGTVSDLLAMLDVTLTETHLVNHDLDTPLTEGLNVAVTQVHYEDYQVQREIEHAVSKPADSLAPGENWELLTAGQNGVNNTTYRHTYVNGELVGQDIIADVVLQKPITAVYDIKRVLFETPSAIINDPKYAYEEGRNIERVAGEETTAVHVGENVRYYDAGEAPVELDENGVPLNYVYKVEGKATAYSNFGNPTLLAPGCVAMDQSLFPFGTSLYIRTPDGDYIYGYSKVADTGTAMVEGKVLVDLFFNTYEESVNFGAKTVEIYVLDYKDPEAE